MSWVVVAYPLIPLAGLIIVLAMLSIDSDLESLTGYGRPYFGRVVAGSSSARVGQRGCRRARS